MLSVLVAHSYFLRFDQKQWERAKPYPPLATLHVASMLRRAGHQVAVFDAMLADGVEDFYAMVERVRPQLVLFYEDSFNFLSKMCLGRMRDASCEMIAHARTHRSRVIAVGSDATDAPEVYLRAGADVVVLGEGLVTLLALVARLDVSPQMATPQLVDAQYGVASLQQGRAVSVNGARPLPNPLYADPPAWELIDLERYRSTWKRAHGHFSLNMAASRGCSFRCNWCWKPIFCNHYLLGCFFGDSLFDNIDIAEAVVLHSGYGRSRFFFSSSVCCFLDREEHFADEDVVLNAWIIHCPLIIQLAPIISLECFISRLTFTTNPLVLSLWVDDLVRVVAGSSLGSFLRRCERLELFCQFMLGDYFSPLLALMRFERLHYCLNRTDVFRTINFPFQGHDSRISGKQYRLV